MAAAVAMALVGLALAALGAAIAFDAWALGRRYILLGIFLTFWVGGAEGFRRRPVYARAMAGLVLSISGIVLITAALARWLGFGVSQTRG